MMFSEKFNKFRIIFLGFLKSSFWLKGHMCWGENGDKFGKITKIHENYI